MEWNIRKSGIPADSLPILYTGPEIILFFAFRYLGTMSIFSKESARIPENIDSRILIAPLKYIQASTVIQKRSVFYEL